MGGAALIAGYGRKRSTRDVDARIVYEKRGVSEAANALARKHDLPANWLNENATLFMPHKDDTQATTVFNSPSLVVTGASARHMLAMKIDAGRPEDVDDIEWLLEQLDITDIDEAIEVHREKDGGRPADRNGGCGNRRPGGRPGRRARPDRQPKGGEPETERSGLRAVRVRAAREERRLVGAEDADRGQRGRARGPQPNTGIQPRWTPRPAEHQRTTDSRPQSRTREGSIRGETQKPGDQVAPRDAGITVVFSSMTRPATGCPAGAGNRELSLVRR